MESNRPFSYRSSILKKHRKAKKNPLRNTRKYKFLNMPPPREIRYLIAVGFIGKMINENERLVVGG
jgi:hypothetical protein